MGQRQPQEVGDEIVAEIRRWNHDEGWRRGDDVETSVADLAEHIETWLKGKR